MLRMRRTTKYVARNTPSASVIVRSLQSREKPCVFRQGPARRAQCSQEDGACQKLHDALRCRSAGALLLMIWVLLGRSEVPTNGVAWGEGGRGSAGADEPRDGHDAQAHLP